MGNIVNRVFDSSGPEGKVRGTPQQIIEKYQILARDAQLSNDRVAEQNFLQHAEHYARMLSEAQREMAREQENRREQQEAQNQGGQGGQGGQNGNRERHDRNEREASADVIEAEGDSGLVETPENAASTGPVFRTEEGAPEAAEQPAAESKPQARRARSPRKPRKQAAAEGSGDKASGDEGGQKSEESPAAE